MRYLLLLSLLLGCQAGTESEESARAQKIIDQAIQVHGGRQYDSLELHFDFRDKHYSAHRQGGLYTYTRSWPDSLGQMEDQLSNAGFIRRVNNAVVKLPTDRAAAYQSSVNSVLYFALLPFGLNDAAVIKTYQEETQLDGKRYHRLKVSFKPHKGGEDHDDQFLYWINADTHTVDYLAYSYAEKDGTGYRFRKAINPRRVGGIRFQDYINYKPRSSEGVSLKDLQSLYEGKQLEEVSRIELENLVVNPI